MFTLKEYTQEIKTNLNAPQKIAFQMPYLCPFPTSELVGGFEQDKAYFFFAKENSLSLRRLRTFFLRQALMQKLRVLVQDPGYLHYEDMRAFLSVETSQNVSMLFDLLLNRQEMLFPKLDKLAQGDITWLRAKACAFPTTLGHKVVIGEAEYNYDMILLSMTQAELISTPTLPQELARNSHSVVIVFVTQTNEEAVAPYPLRCFQQEEPNLENIGEEFNFVADTSVEEYGKNDELRETKLIEIISYAKINSYFPNCKEYDFHDGILEWYVREAE